MKSNVKTGIIVTFELFIYIMLLTLLGIEAGMHWNRIGWKDLDLIVILAFGLPAFTCSIFFGAIGGLIYKKNRLRGIIIGAFVGLLISIFLWPAIC